MSIPLPAPVAKLYQATAELRALYPERTFPLDGHLVGHLGEVIAAEVFGLKLYPQSHKGHDAHDEHGDVLYGALETGRRRREKRPKSISISKLQAIAREQDNANKSEHRLMHHGRGGMGSKKHGRSGHATKSPRFRFAAKMEAEHNSVKSKRAIKDPKSSVGELFNPKRR